MPDSTPPDLADVLADVNRLRAEHGLGEPIDALPQGVRSNCHQCPLAHAFDAKVFPTLVVPAQGGQFLTSVTLMKFVHAFDRGAYPELDA
jgi:hypothetical protein